MKKCFLLLFLLVCCFTLAFHENEDKSQNRLLVYTDSGKITISRHIYGHFSEHLGRCIYDGLWVGEGSKIPNTKGVRNDIIEALKKIKVPNLRWPGGCFADEYHWMDGIGSKEKRPRMVNTNWGGVVEDNSFGTHEFLDLCELIGTEPYISANVGSGSVEEMAKWVEYVNSPGSSTIVELRRKNGRDKPWNVKFWGVGNESWGCGGSMTPEYYSDLYRRYATYCRDYGDNKLYKIASGAPDYYYDWTKVLMKNIGHNMHGLSLHYYTVKGWDISKGSATKFSNQEYFETIHKCLGIEEVLKNHIKIMDEYDPQKKIGLMVDEWGTWFDVEPGTNPGFLYQQNTLRDALVAGATLNIFNKYSDRIRMANIAQLVNVLQALILTKDEKMILTPTYHVFDLYKVHQDATFLPFELNTEDYEIEGKKIPALNVSSSILKDGNMHISIVNFHSGKNIEVACELKGKKIFKTVTGQVLTAKTIQSHNTFENPEEVRIADYKNPVLKNNVLKIQIPAKSIVVLEFKP
jgi:alpha-N-arabinofuranosidase